MLNCYHVTPLSLSGFLTHKYIYCRNRAVVMAPTIAASFYGEDSGMERHRSVSACNGDLLSHTAAITEQRRASVYQRSPPVGHGANINDGKLECKSDNVSICRGNDDLSAKCSQRQLVDAENGNRRDHLANHSAQVVTAASSKTFNPFPKQYNYEHRSRTGGRLRMHSLTSDSTVQRQSCAEPRRISQGEVCTRQRSDKCLREMSAASK